MARPVAFTVLEASFWFATVAGSRLRNLEMMPWASIVIAEGEGDAHRAVVVDGPVTIVRQPPVNLIDAWEARHRSSADWASASFEIRPSRILSYATT